MSDSNPTWDFYLKLLSEDGVQLGECEEEVVREDGRRVTTLFLWREVDGESLSIPIHFEDGSEKVPWYKQRQIANRLRLPPEKYIFTIDPRRDG